MLQLVVSRGGRLRAWCSGSGSCGAGGACDADDGPVHKLQLGSPLLPRRRYLTKKYLKKHNVRDWLRVIARCVRRQGVGDDPPPPSMSLNALQRGATADWGFRYMPWAAGADLFAAPGACSATRAARRTHTSCDTSTSTRARRMAMSKPREEACEQHLHAASCGRRGRGQQLASARLRRPGLCSSHCRHALQPAHLL